MAGKGNKAPGKELDKLKGGEVSTDVDYGTDTGAGMEGVSQDELTLPFLRILQSNSPQVVDQTIPGAKAGLIVNTATNQLLSSFTFVGVHRDHNYIKWVPRDSGGGFAGVMAPDDPIVLTLRKEQGQFGKLVMDAGEHELVETYYLYTFARDDSNEGSVAFRAMLPFASTQIPKYKNFMTRVNTELLYKKADGQVIRPPMWAHVFRATTQPESNKKGKFFGWNIQLAAPTKEASLIKMSDPLYVEAKSFYQMIKEGKAKVDYSKTAGEGSAEGDDPPM